MTEVREHVHVERVGDEHLAALAEFYRKVWDPTATPESVREARGRAGAENAAVPGEPPPTWLVIRDGTAIAHVTTLPIRLTLLDKDHPAYWIKGLWVLPQFQRSAAGFLLLREAVRALAPTPQLALAHNPAALRLFGALGFTDLGTLPNRLRVLRTRPLFTRLDLDALGLQGLPRWMRVGVRGTRVAAPIVGPVADTALTVWAGIGSGALRGLTCVASEVLDREGADALWRAVRGRLGAASSRSADALAARYARGSRYLFVHVRSERGLAALAVVRRPKEDGDRRLRGIRVAILSDLVFAPADQRAGLAALRGAERVARTMGAHALLCSASAARLPPLLRRRGYGRLPGNLHVLTRFTQDHPPAPSRLDEWWVTRGDSHGDDVF